MNQSPRALYEVGSYADCDHGAARLECDFAVSGAAWYVACRVCGSAGPVADTEQVALDGWRELLELADVLVVWNERAADCETVPADAPPSNPRDARPPGRDFPPRPVLAGPGEARV